MNAQDAFHSTVHGYAGGCEALAARMGVAAGVLRNKANPNAGYHKPTLDDSDRIMGLTGDHTVLHALAANHGFVCVKVEGESTTCDVAVLEVITKYWAASGRVGTEVHDTLADGRVEPHEVERVRAAVFAAHRELQQLLARLDGMAQK
ncbi:phage regulatory CII family protein [Oxalobacteraceae bacterium]|nr:phage regulatory CII family protein [Oxalobacteraceae bacterium]